MRRTSVGQESFETDERLFHNHWQNLFSRAFLVERFFVLPCKDRLLNRITIEFGRFSDSTVIVCCSIGVL